MKPRLGTLDTAKVQLREKVEHVPNMYYTKKHKKTASQIVVSRFMGEKTCTTRSLASELFVFQLLTQVDCCCKGANPIIILFTSSGECHNR